MTGPRLVTDADVKGWNTDLRAGFLPGDLKKTFRRLLATRTVAIEFVEALHKHVKEVHFLTCPWCYQIVEKGDVFLAGLHGDTASGTSAPPETERP